jgi:hypothetical protein
MTTDLHPLRTRAGRRSRAVPAVVAPALFLLTGGVLSAANQKALAAWGWHVADHHGVPWPSSLALLPGGWLQTVAFAGTGAALIALGTALPRGARAVSLSICGMGLVAAALPLDLPVGDPSSLGSWVQSWPAAVHAGGFVVSGVAGVLAIAASRRRADLALAGLLAGVAVLGGTPGWYAFLAGFFSWVTALAGRTLMSGPAHLTAPRSGRRA